jgi:polar amino acid transport system permease protein
VKYEISWDVVVAYGPALARGVLLTIQLAGLSVLLGMALGVATVLVRRSRPAPLRWIARGYVEAIRNTPLLIQLYFVYQGLPRIGVRLDSFLAAVLALALYCGAYVSEILRAGIEAVDWGQFEAGRAHGLSELQLFRYVVAPQALRISLPALGSQCISMLKLSSLASVIGAVEFTYVVNDAVALTYRSFELYAVAGLIYLVMTLFTATLLRVLESRLQVPA